jgi:predicted DNA-binding transcriptional regulator YafY
MLPEGHQNMDRARVARQVATLLRLLDGKRVMPAMSDLARELGVSHRTVYRYLDAVEQAGWPLPRRWSE